MPTSAIRTWTNQKLEPKMFPEAARLISVKLGASLNLAKGTILGEKVGTNELVKLTQSGAPTGGTFTLTFGAQTTAAIAYNAPASDIQTALEALSTIGNGNIRVYGGPIDAAPVYLEFRGALAAADQGAVTHTDSLTGGTSPAITVTGVRNGAAGTPGTFVAYSETATDGSQTAVAVLPYDVQTDGSGNITLSDTSGQSGGEQGETYSAIPVYVAGYFDIASLTGLDANAVSQLGRIVSGSIAAGGTLKLA